MAKRAHTQILVNDIAATSSYNYDKEVNSVNVSPTVVLHLNTGDRVRAKNSYVATSDIQGHASIMYSWFSITLLYADE